MVRTMPYLELVRDFGGELLCYIQVAYLSQKLDKKDHQLKMAEHKIDLLHRSMRELEVHMQKLSAAGMATLALRPQKLKT